MKPSITVSLLLAMACAAQAHEATYQAILSGSGAAIPNLSPATGTSTVTLDLDLITMLVEIEFAGLTGSATAAFIHGPTSVPLTGIAGAMTPALSDSGFPPGVASGTYSHLFDLTDAPGYNPAFITSSGGTVSDALNALIFAFEDGKAYLSIQSAAFPGGEIRGFYTEVVPVPEPAAFALIVMGGFALGAIRRRRAE